MKIKEQSGFTLLEVIVTISIMIMFSSFGFTKLTQIQQDARENTDKIVAMNLANAANLYMTTNGSNTVSIEELVNSEYISTEPVPQSVNGGFNINILGSNITVEAGGKTFYPSDKS
ncbi:MAG: type II secretion system protein [Peptostreptococcaceae bacterium]